MKNKALFPFVKRTRIFLVVQYFLFACNNHIEKQAIRKTYTETLAVHQVGQTKYYISLPTDYTVQKTEGPDFEVYYFLPEGTTIKTIKGKLWGGMYVGNNPNPEDWSPAAKTEKINSFFLSDTVTWTVYHYGLQNYIQTVVAGKSGEAWNNYIHAFGSGYDSQEVVHVLDIFSTLQLK